MPEDLALLALIEKHRPKPKRKADGGLVPELLKLAAFKPHVKLYRNNVGCLQDRHGNFVTYGLCVGSSDLIGYKSRIITQADVGTRIAQFCAIEVKRPKFIKQREGKETRRQVSFLDQCRAAGAIAVCVRTVEELEAALR